MTLSIRVRVTLMQIGAGDNRVRQFFIYALVFSLAIMSFSSVGTRSAYAQNATPIAYNQPQPGETQNEAPQRLRDNNFHSVLSAEQAVEFFKRVYKIIIDQIFNQFIKATTLLFQSFMQNLTEFMERGKNQAKELRQKERGLFKGLLDVVKVQTQDAILVIEQTRENQGKREKIYADTLEKLEDGRANNACVLVTSQKSFFNGYHSSYAGASRSANNGTKDAIGEDALTPLEEIDHLSPKLAFIPGSAYNGALAKAEIIPPEGSCTGSSTKGACAAVAPLIGGINDDLLEGEEPISNTPGVNEYLGKPTYTALDSVLTLGEGFYPYSEGGKLKADRERVLALDKTGIDLFIKTLFREAIPFPTKERMKNAFDEKTGRIADSELQEFLLDHRTLAAIRSVGRNSFYQILSRRIPSTKKGEGSSQPTLIDKISEVMIPDIDLLDPDLGEKAKERVELVNRLQQMRNNPSYEAQLAFMSDLLPQQPDFIATTDEADAMQKITFMAAAESIVVWDMFESSTREEALLAVILETLLADKHEALEAKAREINGSRDGG